MAEHRISIDVIDITVPEKNNVNIAVVNKPNRVYGYSASASEVYQLIQIHNYQVYEAGTNKIITGSNYYDYFPEEGSGGGGGVTPEEVQAMIAASIDTSIDDESNNAIANSTMTNFVNSSIATATAEFRGTYTSLEDLEAVTANKNDYAFLQTTDTAGNTLYKRYKYTDNDEWEFEYELNNSSYTAEQWAAINSGVKSSDVSQIGTNALNIAKLQADMAKVGSTFRGVFTTQQAMDAAIADKNDTAILQTTDANGNTVYTMHSYVTVEPSGELPEGYTQLLYIESNGTQAIDTGVVPSSNTGFYLKFKPKPQEIEEVFMGIDGYDNRGFHIEYQAKYYDNGYRLMYGGGTNFITLTRDEINEIEFKPLKLTVNGSTTTISDTGEWYFSGTNSFALFSYKYNTSYSTKSRMCLYEAKFYDDDKITLIRDFVPVRNENNEVGLYDVVNGQFYGNVGTGSFTAGPAADGYWVSQYSFLASIQGSLDAINAIIEGVL